MEIEIGFFGGWVEYSPTGEKRATLIPKDGTTLKDLWTKLRIPHNIEKICLVDGAYHSEEKMLQQSDIISFYPMIDGG